MSFLVDFLVAWAIVSILGLLLLAAMGNRS